MNPFDQMVEELMPPLFLSDHECSIDGTFKQEPEDFLVKEIPSYFPQGEGSHLFLWIEKRDLTTEQVVQQISKRFDIPSSSVGIAGLKDRRGITQQFVSVPEKCADQLSHEECHSCSNSPFDPQVAEELTAEDLALTEPMSEWDPASSGWRILSAKRHPHKLRTGHLKGNQFSILVRTCETDAMTKAEQIANQLGHSGLLNLFGSQRFGHGGSTLRTGWELLTGQRQVQSIPWKRRKFLLRLSLSAVQSALFNLALKDRLRRGIVHQIEWGDVMEVRASGGKFVVEDVPREQLRFDAREIVPTGPLFGPKMKQPQGIPLERESSLLERFQLRQDHFTEFKKLTPGSRRPILYWMNDLKITPSSQGIRIQFSLPPGTYASMAVQEFLKKEL